MRFLAALIATAALALAQAPGARITPKPDYSDLSYGPHANNKLDLWLAKSSRPAPLIVYIHGGGFVGGDKSAASPGSVRRALAAGASFASINYRFLTEVPIQTVLRDCARAIQFLRYGAREYNLDKRVVSMGGSAGAGTSLWLAFHDDLADAGSPDPVLRESSRIAAAASSAGQATYDVLRWKEFLGEGVARYTGDTMVAGFYGFNTAADLHTAEGRRTRADVDMLGLITKDDPPVYLTAHSRHDALRNRGDYNHSPKHSIAVKERCDEVGVEAVLKIVNDGQPAQAGSGALEFLLRHLGVAP